MENRPEVPLSLGRLPFGLPLFPCPGGGSCVTVGSDMVLVGIYNAAVCCTGLTEGASCPLEVGIHVARGRVCRKQVGKENGREVVEDSVGFFRVMFRGEPVAWPLSYIGDVVQLYRFTSKHSFNLLEVVTTQFYDNKLDGYSVSSLDKKNVLEVANALRASDDTDDYVLVLNRGEEDSTLMRR